MKRRLSAILAADVVGFSRLVGADEEDTIARLKALRNEVIDDSVVRHNGRIFKTTGDGILAEFSSVVSAVQCAVEIQQAATDRETELPEDRRIHLRIGIDLGDIIIDGDDILGDGVNIAARLEGLAEPGGVCVSAKVYEEVHLRLELTFEDAGQRKVKNITRPIHVWQWNQAAGATGKSSPVASLDLPEKPSVAILPFLNMSADPEQEYFSDGITEDIITELSRLRWLFVSSRNSSFTYKGRAVDVRQVAQELGVRYVLEGSVRKAGNRVRITAQLIDAPNDNHIWAQRFDRVLEDIFELQDEIASLIASTVNVEVGEEEQERATRRMPESLHAWELYHRGMRHLWRQSKPDYAEARAFFNRAIEIDGKFASAYAGLAYIGALEVNFGYTDSLPKTLADALEAGNRAISLDDRDAMGHFALGRIHTYLGDEAAALAAARTAIELSPSFAAAHYGLGFSLFWFGRAAEAESSLDLAIRLSPRDPSQWAFHTMLAWCRFFQGNYSAAEESVRSAFQSNPKEFWPHFARISILVRQDRIDEARAACSVLLDLKPEMTIATIRPLISKLYADYVEEIIITSREAGLPD